MTMQDAGSSGTARVQEGEDYVCSNCGCEVRVRHAGDQSKMTSGSGTFTCCCGEEMRVEQR